MTITYHTTHCLTCGSELTGRRVKFCSTQCGNKFHHEKRYQELHPHTGHCINCDAVLTSRRQKLFCSIKCKTAYSGTTYNSAPQSLRGRERKNKLIELKGGACSVCGYNKSIRALCFHHIDPSQKSMKLDARTLSGSSWERILKESDKCQLLCHNCHAETHEELEENKTT